jgi:hypothetical protein
MFVFIMCLATNETRARGGGQGSAPFSHRVRTVSSSVNSMATSHRQRRASIDPFWRQAQSGRVSNTFSFRTASALALAIVACQSAGMTIDPRTNVGPDAGDDSGIDASTDDAGAAMTNLPSFPHNFSDAALAGAAYANKPPDATCDAGATATGVGLACTRGGRQCPPRLLCTADFIGDGGICTILGCGGMSADCGPGASCCTLLAAGGASLCYPNACLPNSCLEGD